MGDCADGAVAFLPSVVRDDLLVVIRGRRVGDFVGGCIAEAERGKGIVGVVMGLVLEFI